MEKTMPVDEGAEAFVELLNANNVEYIFLNPGTDTFPIQEALSKFKALGKQTPKVILSLHESVAMAAAHGYFMISGRPQVVMVHVDVGTLQVGGALHNAQRGRAGIIFCAGRTPSTFEQDKRGERSGSIHWLQEQFDQAGAVRGYVKWEYELRTNENIHQVVQRAFQIASTEPCGPVYLSLPRELLMEKIKSVRIPAVARHAAAATPQADTALLSKLAVSLINAETPLIMTGDTGRHPQSVAALVELAETVGARVITDDARMNFPTTHPLCAGSDPNPYLKDADVLLLIDCDIPYVPAQARPKPDAEIIHISIDPVKQDMPLWVFPADVLIQADSSKAIPALTDVVRQKVTLEQQAQFQARTQRLQGEHQQLRDRRHSSAIAKAEQKPISPEWLCRCIDEEIDEDTILLNESVTNRPSTSRQIERTRSGTLFSSGGTSLGWGLGAALGVKLAIPDKTIVTLMGDGSFIFGCPIPALWAASVYQAPFLAVIFNNQLYHAPKRALRGAYGEGSFSEKTGLWVGMDIVPSPNFALIAQACGAYGQTVEDPSALQSALRDALDQVRRGKPAVLDVRIESP
ncbi:thiamine pyrophosphate-requiring protein [Chloroflexota bacterium]